MRNVPTNTDDIIDSRDVLLACARCFYFGEG